jgi:hypothetical protein
LSNEVKLQAEAVMPDHSLLWLALMTFFVVLGFVGWSYVSTRRRQMYGPDVSGPGSKDDPMAGPEVDMETPYMQSNFDNKPRPAERKHAGQSR